MACVASQEAFFQDQEPDLLSLSLNGVCESMDYGLINGFYHNVRLKSLSIDLKQIGGLTPYLHRTMRKDVSDFEQS